MSLRQDDASPNELGVRLLKPTQLGVALGQLHRQASREVLEHVLSATNSTVHAQPDCPPRSSSRMCAHAHEWAKR